MTASIVHVTDVFIMSATAIFPCVHHKDAAGFSSVQGFCTDCIRIFICVAAHDGRNVGAAFVPPIVQGIKHLFRIRKLLFAVRESASSLKLLFL